MPVASASIAGYRTRAIDTADPETRRIATKYLESTYLPSTAGLSERVAELTRRLLPTGQCSAEAIADQLALHPRTLQRQLAAEGVRCHDIIDGERMRRVTSRCRDCICSRSSVCSAIPNRAR